MKQTVNIVANLCSLFLFILFSLTYSIQHFIYIPGLDIFLYTMLILAIVFFSVCVAYSIKQALSESNAVTVDPLTKLNTLQGFTRKCKRKFQQYQYSGYIVVMDIAKFRMLNERYGIDVGNEMLVKVSHILNEVFEKHAIKCRIHSDIFCIYAYKTQSKELANILYEITIRMRTETTITMEPSFGIYKLKNEISLKTAICYAELALKKAKESITEQWMEFTQEMLTQMELNMDIEQNMYQAISNKDFQIYLQPKYSITSNKVVGAESLVRWISPENGIMRPDEFIPIFEKNGFIKELDYYMWDGTAEIIANWIAQGITPVPISVNISRAHVLGKELCNILFSIISKHNIPAKYLQLEFTESAYNDNIEGLHDTMNMLHKMGFTILMDDFGSGYSSLNMLKDYPVDIIKTDKEFLNLKENDKRGECIVYHIIQMILELGLDVIAEGVETAEQAELLKKCGCSTIQGYYYSPPVHHTKFRF